MLLLQVLTDVDLPTLASPLFSIYFISLCFGSCGLPFFISLGLGVSCAFSSPIALVLDHPLVATIFNPLPFFFLSDETVSPTDRYLVSPS